MLKITIPKGELFNEETESFIPVESCNLQLEHSLVSLSKWESKWHKPFLTKEDHTHEEITDYIRCMTITQNVDPNSYKAATNENINCVAAYIDDPMTATTFSDVEKKKFNQEIITAEIIYYWMIAMQIPFECEKWHLNRLLTLIRVCDIKNKPAKKMSAREQAAQNRALNEARQKQYGTNG